MAQFYYIEPSVTYDLDLIVHISGEENNLNPLSPIYTWADENDYKTEGEHIIIEGMPVQFLLAYNELVEEALQNCVGITIFNERTFILSAEYVMAIMLQTGRITDKERLAKFFIEAEFNKVKFFELVKRFSLEETYKKSYGDKNG
ncbi:MAG: hypothetical protein Q8N83_14575 [Ignavibacteria bacterium]|nr:hypothetical protein [Ignavibacteria bacterium]